MGAPSVSLASSSQRVERMMRRRSIKRKMDEREGIQLNCWIRFTNSGMEFSLCMRALSYHELLMRDQCLRSLLPSMLLFWRSHFLQFLIWPPPVLTLLRFDGMCGGGRWDLTVRHETQI